MLLNHQANNLSDKEGRCRPAPSAKKVTHRQREILFHNFCVDLVAVRPLDFRCSPVQGVKSPTSKDATMSNRSRLDLELRCLLNLCFAVSLVLTCLTTAFATVTMANQDDEIGRASCRERV